MALLSARKVETEEDWQIVLTVLTGMERTAHARPRKAMHKIVSWEATYNFMAENGHLWIVDGYLVFFDIITPWYSDQIILSELLIVRAEQGGTFTSVTQFLREQARAAGAVMVAAGTTFASSDRALSKLYQAEGFTPEATLLTTET